MKYFRYILLPFLLLLTLAGCTRDEVQMEKTGDVRLSLNIPETIQSKSTTIYPGESTISNVYILFYAQGAADSAEPAFFHSATGLNLENNWSKSFKTTEMSNLEANTTYEVYALASLPDGVTLTASTTKGDLLNLQEEISKQTINAWKISFSGTATYRTGTLGEVPIELKRTVARLEINVENHTSSSNLKLWLAKAPASTFYLKPATTSTLTDCNKEIGNISSAPFRCYLYENPANSAPVVLQLAGTTQAGETISYSVEVKPDNSSKIVRNTSYNVTIKLREGDITVSTGTSLPWGATSTLTPPTLDKIKVLPSANTYIIKPSKTIRFPVDRPALAHAVNSAIPAIAADEELTAELVWTDVKGSTSGLADDASIAKIKVTGSGPDAFMQVTTGSQPGNSVVAVKGEDGSIKWSWQIWVTDYDPETTNGTLEGITYMDRNIGALQNNKDPEAIGTYYQWGRPHPFPTRKKNEHVFTPVYDANGNTVTIATAANITDISQTIANPATYATKYTVSESLWDENQKTVFDPCPAGWRVPSIAFLNKITYEQEGIKSTPPYYQVSGTNIYFPCSWYINTNYTLSPSTQQSTYTWSSTKSAMRFGVSDNTTISPAMGSTVRCIKQTNP